MPTNIKSPRVRGAPPTGLRWFEIYFDRELTRADVVRGLQPLAYRPRVGWSGRIPVVVFELRATSRSLRWLVGMVVIEPDGVHSVGINVLAGDTSQAERRADQIVHLLSELHGGNLGPRSTDVRLQDERSKLLTAHYAGAVPLDLLKTEMVRLTSETADAEHIIADAKAAAKDLEVVLNQALLIASNCAIAYLSTDTTPGIRRQFNQGLFKALYVNIDGISRGTS